MTTPNPGSIPQYNAVMKIVEELVLLDPAVVDTLDTPEGFLLDALSDAMVKYEGRYWPIGDKNEELPT